MLESFDFVLSRAMKRDLRSGDDGIDTASRCNCELDYGVLFM
jgi:hypothetical protein